MNQNFYYSNSSGFDQTRPPQFPVIHPPPQETSIEILHDQENAINYVQTFLRKFNRYSFFETPKELAEYINTLGWNRPAFYNNGDDDDEDYSITITPDFLITDSLIMGDEHLDTIPEKESDKFIKSSVEDLVPNPNLDSTPKNDHFDTESYLLESLLNRDTLMASSLNIDSLLAEFAGELIFLISIPSRIDEANCDPEEDILLIERLLYDNSSPRPSKEFVSENFDAEIESFSPSPIPNEDSDSLMEEIDLSFTPNDPMPPGIEEDDYESERDILILKDLPSNDTLSLPENESFYFDIPSFSRPPAKPPDGNTETLNIKMMGDISEQKVLIPGLMITLVPN
nr:hypothetical protein [Tanacetum cinerariifolium]